VATSGRGVSSATKCAPLADAGACPSSTSSSSLSSSSSSSSSSAHACACACGLSGGTEDIGDSEGTGGVEDARAAEEPGRGAASSHAALAAPGSGEAKACVGAGVCVLVCVCVCACACALADKSRGGCWHGDGAGAEGVGRVRGGLGGRLGSASSPPSTHTATPRGDAAQAVGGRGRGGGARAKPACACACAWTGPPKCCIRLSALSSPTAKPNAPSPPALLGLAMDLSSWPSLSLIFLHILQMRTKRSSQPRTPLAWVCVCVCVCVCACMCVYLCACACVVCV
jgi:hypothetical protein